MKRLHALFAGLFILPCALAASGCVAPVHNSPRTAVVAPPSRGHGPPAHAPAHGYRRKFQQHGVSLTFDSGLGVYVVVDLSDVFFSDGRYYRFDGGRWFWSARPKSGWDAVAVSELPSGLRGFKGSGAEKRRGGHKGRPW